MAVGTAPNRVGPAPRSRRPPIRRGRAARVRPGQIVATQVAAVPVIFALGHGLLSFVAAVVFAGALLTAVWVRTRGKWVFEWCAVALGYLTRRHTVEAPDPGSALLELAAPGARLTPVELDGDAAAVVVDGDGLTALLELGDLTGVLAEPLPDLPSPVSLLPGATSEAPPLRLQLLLSATPATTVRAGSSIPANSYRQLTEGRLLSHARVLLAVRVLRTEGWSAEEMHRCLAAAVHRLHRRLGPVSARPLGEAATLRALADAAHCAGPDAVEERGSGVRLGGLTQATFRLMRWPTADEAAYRRLMARLLALPAAATTMSLTIGPRTADGNSVAAGLTIRIAAPNNAALAVAATALRATLSAERAYARRLDGEHMSGLVATLPVAVVPWPEVPGQPPTGRLPEQAFAGWQPSFPIAGLMIGRNRHGAPVVARLFRPEPTRVLVVGGFRCAQLVALRAMGTGARVIVQTARPQAWEPFVRGAAVPGESITVTPPGRPLRAPAGTALHPQLVIVDVGPVGADPRPGQPWRTTLVVRDDFAPVDLDVAARADLLLFQPLRADEAALAAGSLGLGDAAAWFTQIRQDMVGVVNRRAVRWATLSPTTIEAQLIGPPVRG